MVIHVHRVERVGKGIHPAVPAVLCFLVMALARLSFASDADPESTRLVVVLYPEANDGAPGNALADRGIRAGFRKSTRETVQIHSEYLDISRFPDADYQQELASFLQRKYADRKVDLVMAGLASGLEFAVNHRQQMFPQAPIVFLCVDENEARSRKLDRDVIGVPLKMGMRDSLNLALSLHPATEQVFVVVGRSKYDSFWEAESRKRFEDIGKQTKLTYLAGLPMPDLLSRVANLPNRSLIYYLHVFEDGDGRVHVPAEVLTRISAAANAPVYSHVSSYLGRGIVGGRVYSFEREGERAAELGLRIFAGEKPEQIGIQRVSDNDYVFDWRQLKRWGIPQSSLPEGSVVYFQEPTAWDLYKWHILGTALLVLLQSALITGLVVQRMRRGRAERRFQQAVNAAPTGMVMIDSQGRIVVANKQMEKLFGYSQVEMKGQPVDMLAPARYRDERADDRRAYFGSPEAWTAGADRDLIGCRSDGTEFPVEIGLNPLENEAGHFVLASVVDVSERRRAQRELLENQNELEKLTGKLLVAQESERGRIARELHDDFGQELALLSVEIDILRRAPESDAQFGTRVEALSSRVKHLSTAIHELSHQLHPMKLEQLGLVAALRALCKEIMQSHPLQIVFEPGSFPQTNHRAVALCLYRIAQEALRNVVKHSGAKRCTIDLNATAAAVSLRVRDDGRGFDLGSAASEGGLGLVSMRERLRAVQGELSIDARPSFGTEIQVRIPIVQPIPVANEEPMLAT